MSVLDNFEQWKSFLHDRVEQAKRAGMSQDVIANVASHIGDYLAQEVDPKNPEEKLLKELWKAADEKEQRTLANIMVKMVQ